MATTESTETVAPAAAVAAGDTGAPKRKSRPLRRKTSHSVIERRRREKINEGLIQLQATVPACREELRELLAAKVAAKKGGPSSSSKRATERDVGSEVDRLMEEKVETQMILEKLCIISHTVDYVHELHEKLAAYRRMCRCSPPLAATLQEEESMRSKQHQHRLDVHEHVGRDQEAGTEGNVSSSQTSSPILAGQDSVKTVPQASCCGAKRKRHWGSNKPLDIKSGETLPTAVPKKVQAVHGVKERSVRPKRKAAPSKFDKETSESVPDDEEMQTGQEEQEQEDIEHDMLEDESESDHSSDLELDPIAPHSLNKGDQLPNLSAAPFDSSIQAPSIVASLPSLRSLYANVGPTGTTQAATIPLAPEDQGPSKKGSGSKNSHHGRSKKEPVQYSAVSMLATPSSFLRRRRATDVGLFNPAQLESQSDGRASFGEPVTHACGQVHAPGLPVHKEAAPHLLPPLVAYPDNSPQRRRRSFSPSDRVLPGHSHT